MKRFGFQRSQNFELGLVSRDGIAILLPGVAFWLSLVFEISLGNPFWFLFPSAVIASTWFCGKSPGWLTTVISMVVVQYYLTPPLRSFVITRRDLPFSFTFPGMPNFRDLGLSSSENKRRILCVKRMPHWSAKWPKGNVRKNLSAERGLNLLA